MLLLLDLLLFPLQRRVDIFHQPILGPYGREEKGSREAGQGSREGMEGRRTGKQGREGAAGQGRGGDSRAEERRAGQGRAGQVPLIPLAALRCIITQHCTALHCSTSAATHIISQQ